MKVLASFLLTAVFSLPAWSAAAGARGGHRIFIGNISDSACGLHHMMASNARQCTLECVHIGSRLVLADEAHQKVYGLSDQAKAMPLAGEQVEVLGTLKRYTIEVISIKPVNKTAPQGQKP